MVDFEVGVILPCAGLGERLGGVLPKQYCTVLGKPLFMYALEAFQQLPYVKKIALVVDKQEQVQSLIQESGASLEKIVLVKGEATRHRSIKAGLMSLQKSGGGLKVVVVHDAVRPLVPSQLVQELVLAADSHGAAGVTRPLVSTVLVPGPDGLLLKSLDRSKHVASETPQAFQLAILTAAFTKCSDEELDAGTECLQLVRDHVGVCARLLSGPEDLWKVTHKKDIYAAAGCLREVMNKVCIVAAENDETVAMLTESLRHKVSSVKHVRSAATAAADDGRHGTRGDDMFNTAVFFHVQEIDQENQLLEFANMLDIEKQGLIVHVIDHTSSEGAQTMSVCDLHRSGRTMARHYEKLRKGVVVIHCLTAGEDRRLADIVSSLVLSGATTFSGQTLFV